LLRVGAAPRRTGPKRSPLFVGVAGYRTGPEAWALSNPTPPHPSKLRAAPLFVRVFRWCSRGCQKIAPGSLTTPPPHPRQGSLAEAGWDEDQDQGSLPPSPLPGLPPLLCWRLLKLRNPILRCGVLPFAWKSALGGSPLVPFASPKKGGACSDRPGRVHENSSAVPQRRNDARARCRVEVSVEADGYVAIVGTRSEVVVGCITLKVSPSLPTAHNSSGRGRHPSPQTSSSNMLECMSLFEGYHHPHPRLVRRSATGAQSQAYVVVMLRSSSSRLPRRHQRHFLRQKKSSPLVSHLDSLPPPPDFCPKSRSGASREQKGASGVFSF